MHDWRHFLLYIAILANLVAFAANIYVVFKLNRAIKLLEAE